MCHVYDIFNISCFIIFHYLIKDMIIFNNDKFFSNQIFFKNNLENNNFNPR